jgi:hypothetical protein
MVPSEVSTAVPSSQRITMRALCLVLCAALPTACALDSDENDPTTTFGLLAPKSPDPGDLDAGFNSPAPDPKDVEEADEGGGGVAPLSVGEMLLDDIKVACWLQYDDCIRVRIAV